MPGCRQDSRRRARQKAFQVLYSLCFSPPENLAELRLAFERFPRAEAAAPALAEKSAGFDWELVEGVWTHLDALDAAIGRFSKKWRLERIGRLELTILRLAAYEIFHRPDIPLRVAINEALELAGQFGESQAKKFINGILDSLAKTGESAAPTRREDSLPKEG